MKQALVHARQLVTLQGGFPRRGPEMEQLNIIEDGAVIWNDSEIERVGSTDSLASELRHIDQVVDASGKVVTPGLVDAHTHLVFGGNRVEEYDLRSRGESYEEISRQGGGITRTVELTREATLDELVESGHLKARWMAKSGTTTCEAKSGYGLNLATEKKILNAYQELQTREDIPQIIPTFLGAHSIPKEFKSDPEQYVSLLIEEMIPAVDAEWCDIFCESIAFTHDQARRILQVAKSKGMKLRMHVDQLRDSGGAFLAVQVGAITADHLEHTGLLGIAAMAEADVIPVLLPGSVYALGHETYPAAREMIEQGLPVVLATDFNPGSSPTPSLPMIMSLACTHMKMSPAEALTACTINAAHSLDRAEKIGSVEAKKAADLVLWSAEDYREIAYYFGVNLVDCVWRNGHKIV